jgi:uncharacterized protein YjbI with pentapeptide repeats
MVNMVNIEHFERLKAAIGAKDIMLWNQWRVETSYCSPDLSEANLNEANLYNADLRGADLRGASLQKAILTSSNLSAADLRKADLSGAYLSCANLSGTYMSDANLSGANLVGAHLHRAEMNNTNFHHATLSGMDLHGVRLWKADLKGADLRFANLGEAELWESDLRGADLRAANLQNANVYGVRYNRWGKFSGIRVGSCCGSPGFKRLAQDQEYIEEFRRSPSRYVAYILWLVLSDCGRSLFLWTFWCMLTVVGFAYRYWNMGPDAFRHTDLPWQPASTIYYSVVTFTTLGFGDIAPRTIPAAMWVMAEVIMGYVMLGGLISIFANKLARRG